MAEQSPAPSPDIPPAPPARPGRLARNLREAGPTVAAGLAFIAIWEITVHALGVSKFVLPPPTMIAASMIRDFPYLMQALAYTAGITVAAFLAAVVSGILGGLLLTQHKDVERMLWPYAIALQVTPMVAIAPLVIIWVGLDRVWLGLMILAWLVAFFPMLANTVQGLKSADRGLQDVMSLYQASRWQRFRHLQLPAALPYILTGARISSSLAVIGGVVAEFVAGSGASTGLAWVIVESGTMLDVPRMFAALFILSIFGLAIWWLTSLVQARLLSRWHESELGGER
ncbi:ABC transporter permease [Mangrovicoccus algicola]|uniref:ABC transporter permease n=1 Tax=Mangrovicoccus algicola TaxID=2771008 RepID=UPI001D02D3F4|nr:ABC transporter permease [Mangrovicoccus algicola]